MMREDGWNKRRLFARLKAERKMNACSIDV